MEDALAWARSAEHRGDCPGASREDHLTRFIPARKPGHGTGMWRHYYERWASMTIEQMGPDMAGLVPELAAFVPPARVKHVYSPWTGTDLHQQLRGGGIDTIIITGGETDVCVLSTMLGAIDWGFRVILVQDALCSSADETLRRDDEYLHGPVRRAGRNGHHADAS